MGKSRTILAAAVCCGISLLAGCACFSGRHEDKAAAGDRQPQRTGHRVPPESLPASATRPLIASIRNPESLTRYLAAQSLGFIGDRRAVPSLIEALGDEDGQVRSAAARSLGLIGDARATSSLVVSLDDGEYSVRLAAAGALDALGWQPAAEREAQRYRSVRLEESTRTKIDSTVVEPLVAALGDSTLFVRVQAARLLDRYGWRPRTRGQRLMYTIAKGEAIRPERYQKAPVEDHKHPLIPPSDGFDTAPAAGAQGGLDADTVNNDTGMLHISVKPDVAVCITIDGKVHPEAAGSPIMLPAGRHLIEVAEPGFRYYADERDVTIRSGKLHRITIELEDLFPPISKAVIRDLAEEHFKERKVRNIHVVDVWQFSRTKCLASITYEYQELHEYKVYEDKTAIAAGYFQRTPRRLKHEDNPVFLFTLEGSVAGDRRWKIVSIFDGK